MVLNIKSMQYLKVFVLREKMKNIAFLLNVFSLSVRVKQEVMEMYILYSIAVGFLKNGKCFPGVYFLVCENVIPAFALVFHGHLF